MTEPAGTFLPSETRNDARMMAAAALELYKQRKAASESRATMRAQQDAADPVDWIKEHFWIPESEVEDRRLKLGAYQEWALRRCLTLDEDGTWPYALVIWSDIKKSIKSTIAAAVAVWVAWTTDWAQVYVVSNDLKQSQERVWYYASRAIQLNPEKFSAVRIVGNKIIFPNGAFIEAIPVDPSGEAGSNADLVIFSELWGAQGSSQAHQRMWTEMTLSPMKQGRSMRWVETYAGHVGESVLLEQLYTQAVIGGEQIPEGEAPTEHHWGSDPLNAYEYLPGRQFALWNDRPRLPWQTPEYYAQEAATLTPTEFQRVHRNQWVTSSDEFVPMEWFDACGEPGILDPLPGPKKAMVLAADASITGDTTALAGVTVDWDPRTMDQPEVNVVIAYRWQPSKAEPMDYEKTLVPKIVAACERFNVLQIAYDNFQLHQTMMNLRDRHLVWAKDFSQGKDREVADKSLRDLIKHRRLHWYPDAGQFVLREHFANANAKVSGPDADRIRIIKRAPHLHVDLAVAVSMATSEALRIAV